MRVALAAAAAASLHCGSTGPAAPPSAPTRATAAESTPSPPATEQAAAPQTARGPIDDGAILPAQPAELLRHPPLAPPPPTGVGIPVIQRGHDSDIFALAFDATNTLLASTDIARITIWDVATHTARARIAQPGMAHAMAFDPRGRLLAIAQSDTVLVIDLATGTITHRFDCDVDFSEPEGLLLWTPDGQTFIATCRDRLRVWNGDVTAERYEVRLQHRTDHVTTLSPDHARLAYTSADHTVQVRAVADGRLFTTLDIGSAEDQRSGAATPVWRPDGGALAIAGEAGVFTFDTATWQPGPKRPGGTSGVAYSPAGDQLVLSERLGPVIWEPASGASIRIRARNVSHVEWPETGVMIAGDTILRGPPWKADYGLACRLCAHNHFAWSRDRTLLAQSGDKRGVRVVDVATHGEHAQMPAGLDELRFIHQSDPFILFAGPHGVAFDLRTGTTRTLKSYASLSPDNTRALQPIVTDAQGPPSTVWELVDVATGRRIAKADFKVTELREVQWSGDGTLVLTTRRDAGKLVVKTWRGRDLAPASTIQVAGESMLEPLPHGTLAVAIEGHRLVDLATGKSRAIPSVPDGARNLVAAPSGKRFALGLQIYETSTLATVGRVGALLTAFRPGHEDEVLVLEGNNHYRLVRAGDDSTRLEFDGWEYGVNAEFSDDGSRLAAHAKDGMRVWDVDTSAVVADPGDFAGGLFGRRCIERWDGDAVHFVRIDTGATLDLERVDDTDAGFVAIRSDGVWQAGATATDHMRLRPGPSVRDGALTVPTQAPVKALDIVPPFIAGCR